MSVFKAGLFANKVAIVTGGGSGIGRSISYELLSLGCKVVVASRNKDRLENAVEYFRDTLKSPNDQITAIACNIRSESDVKDLIARTLETYGKVDYLVNNGGGQYPAAASEFSLKGWNAVIETNLTGTFLVCKEAFNSWFKDNGGSIVNIIADMFRGMPLMAHTGAARAAVENLTKSLAVEWAENGVRVNAVAPGSSIYSKTAAENYNPQENIFEWVRPGIPAKRLGTPEEISSAVCFLLSPAASFISGATLRVDGCASLYSPMFQWNIPDHKNIPQYKWNKEPATPSSSPNVKSKL